MTTLTRAQELTNAYSKAVPLPAGALKVITDRPEAEARARALQAKLRALGITDVSQEGRLILGGSVEITPGLRKGIGGMIAHPQPSDTLDLDTLPQLFEYTRAGRVSPMVKTATPTPLADASELHGDTTSVGTTRLNQGRTLVMLPSPGLLVDEALIVAEELQIQDGTNLIIANHVKYLTIIAQRITVGSSTQITWVAESAPARGAPVAGKDGTSYRRTIETPESAYYSPSGGDGWAGAPGDPGYAGDDAPTLEIWGLAVSLLPAIELQGGKGGTGQRGGDGGAGGDGAKGLHSHSMAWGCDRSVGYGGDGGDGGDGGKGGAGGTGGKGGDLLLYLTDSSHEAVLAAGLKHNSAGGQEGEPGSGGSGGDKGYGGEPGDPDGLWCHPKSARAGANGQDGDDGASGASGRRGPTGELTAVVITPDEFRTKWTAPQIRTVTPWEAEVGNEVTIKGANFTTDATVRFAGVTGDTTFIADTILQAEVPAVGTGWVEVVVNVPGGQTSNPGSLKVIPTLYGISPNPAAVGAKITIYGGGFVPGCHVLFRGLELNPAVAADGNSLDVTLPAPQGPFEDFGGVEPIAVRNPDGVATATVNLVLRHVLSTGFDVAHNGYAFTNTPQAGLANMRTFEETYGTADVLSSFLLEPVLTGAWYTYYRHFFNQIQPGYSSGFSTTAADVYWSGNPNLSGDYASIAEVERLLTIAQGHILSREMLNKLAGQAAAGVGRAETSLAEVEVAFRNHLFQSPDERRRSAPIMQLIPAGTITTPGFINNLSHSHGLLPIRVEYPAKDDAWERRLIVYDNAGEVGVESQITFTRTSVGLEFVLSGDRDNRDTAHGWTLSQASLQDNWFDDKSMPFDYLFLLSPATVLVEDEQGRRFGISGRQVWNDLPDVIPAIGAKNLYLLPLDRNLRFSVFGTGAGTYTLGIVAGSLGRSLTLADVPVGPETRDVVEIADGLRAIKLSSQDAEKQLTLHYGVGGVRQARALTITGARMGKRGGLTLRSADNLASFELEGAPPHHLVTLGLSAANHTDVRQQRFEQVALGERRVKAFRVDNWQNLGPESLHVDEPSAALENAASANL